MDYKKKIEIPFGAFDSELEHQEINIPNGFKAVIDGNKIILTRAESEDEKIRKSLIILLQHFCKGYRVPGLEFPVSYKDMLAWLEKQGEQKPNPYNKEWDENDEEMLRSIIATCELAEADRDSSPARHLLEMQLDWLNSLKGKCTWKPSDEQMELLKDASARYEGLQSLYNDLNKLKGE